MRYVSMFSGIEAASVAFNPLGWEPVAFAEIEPFPSAVLAHHYPDVPNVGDVTMHDWSQYRGRCDLVIGGPPCQAFSIAGLRKSLADDRGNLSLAYVKAVDAINPLWCIAENVPGWLSVADNAFGCFLAAMAGDDAAYVSPTRRWPDAGVVSGPKRTIAWRIQDAQYHGLAQRRRRVFVLAVRGSGNWRSAAALFPLSEGLRGDSPPRRETGEGVAPTISARTKGGGGLGTDFDCDGGLIAGKVTARAGNGPDSDCTTTLVTHSLRADGFDASEDGTGRGTPLVATAFAQNQRDEVREMAIAGALAKETGMKQQTYIAFTSKDHGQDAGDLSPTLRAMGHAGSHANGGGQVAVAFDMRGREGGAQFEGPHDTANIRAASGGSSRSYVAASAVRRLTPRECCRLQGFPDDYFDITYRGKPAADGPKYKALGNSMAVPVVQWLGRRIQAVSATE